MNLSFSRSFQNSPCDVIYYAPDAWATYSQLFKLCLPAEAARSVRAPRSMDWPGNCVTVATDRALRVWLGHPLSGYAPTGWQTLLQHAVHTARALVVLDGAEGRVTGSALQEAITYARAMGVPRVVLWHDGHEPARLRAVVRSAGYSQEHVASVTAKLKPALRCRCLAPDCEDCRPATALRAALGAERTVSTRVLLPVMSSEYISPFGIHAGTFVVWWPRGETRGLPIASGALVDVVTSSAMHRLPVAEIAPKLEPGGTWGPGVVFRSARPAWRDVVGLVSPEVAATHAQKLELLRRYSAGELVHF